MKLNYFFPSAFRDEIHELKMFKYAFCFVNFLSLLIMQYAIYIFSFVIIIMMIILYIYIQYFRKTIEKMIIELKTDTHKRC